jgi:indole-3-glycerol phosphate synthase
MTVLDRIVETKREELAQLRRSAHGLEAAALAAPPAPAFEAALRSGPHVAVIAEVKRCSPSAGAIRSDAGVSGAAGAAGVAAAYDDAGAAAISVLTDRIWFGGELADLQAVSSVVRAPVLRKDFTIDALQVYEARSAGAAAVLLIVRILDDAQLRDLAVLSAELGMDVLVEVHDESELERAVSAGARIIGVNNRDLATFATDLGVTERLARLAPGGCVLVGESGIGSAADVSRLAAAGVDAVLVGEALMRAGDPSATVRAFGAVARRGRS